MSAGLTKSLDSRREKKRKDQADPGLKKSLVSHVYILGFREGGWSGFFYDESGLEGDEFTVGLKIVCGVSHT